MGRQRTKHNECYTCVHRRNIRGDAHISCANPDPEMQGHPYGIKSGWFIYPIKFDPAWKLYECNNYEATGSK